MIRPELQQRVNAQLGRLRKVRFTPDPLFPDSLPRQVEASAIKRHGPLIEAAIIQALAAQPEYEIWIESRFMVPSAADHAVQSQGADENSISQLPYSGQGRALQIDLMAYWRPHRRLGAYEIKRGHGRNDSGKLRSIRRDVFAVQTTLASYGRRRGLIVDEAVSRIIFYFGKCTLPKPWALAGAELEEHFGFPVRQTVDDMTEYYRAGLVGPP